MATCLKRTSKLFDPSLWRSPSHVNLRDLLCPVCRGILIEPVTLPCEHNLCLRCLNGTVEHNNLNCPLCRTRVGSWLRTAGKSNTLVNLRLWEIIRKKFPKEVEGKENGDERHIDLDSGYAARTKILSAAGEIRKEYEAQLHLAEEERRRKIQAEAIASEALIRKIQAEEQQQLAQLAQDELLAKTLAKEEVNKKVDPKMKRYGESSKTLMSNSLADNSKTEPRIPNNMQKAKAHSVFDGTTTMVTKFNTSIDSRKTNIALISKIRVESYASSIKSAGLKTCKESSEKLGTSKPLPVQDAVTRLFKNQVSKFVQPNNSGFIMEPSCSNSNIYGLQSKEELHVPNDVLSSNKKSLGVEICMNTVTDDARIGSAESAESHDSINQEIHHFKPIKSVQRTPLRTTRDGRQIDPKVVRVVPILKKVSNAVPKPPSPSRVKRTLGCSWSAFRGKIQDSRLSKVAKMENPEPESKPLISSQIITGTLVKPQVSDKLDHAPEMSFDTNKNYAKNINRIINGTKVSKKLNLEGNESVEKVKKPWELCNEPKSTCDSDPNTDNTDGESVNSEASSSRTQKVFSEGSAVENIAERIKKRKTHLEIHHNNNTEDFVRRSSRKRATAVTYVTEDFESFDENSEVEDEPPKRKRAKKKAPKLEKVKGVIQNSLSKITSGPPELTVEAPQKKRRGRKPNKKPIEVISSAENDSFEAAEKSTKNTYACDEEVISEQKRIEKQLLQEQKDRELAERLQAQFNEWETMSGRTRNSRRAFEGSNEEDLGLGLGKRSRRYVDPQSSKQTNQTKSGRSQRRPQQAALK